MDHIYVVIFRDWMITKVTSSDTLCYDAVQSQADKGPLVKRAWRYACALCLLAVNYTYCIPYGGDH